jgi:hypothetical protein
VSAVVIGAQSAASAAPRGASVAVTARSRAFFDVRDHLRPVDPVRGPFFGLRVHSMDVGGEAENLACFEYACDGLRPGSPAEKYELVRTAYKVRVAPGECDEVMKLPLAPTIDVQGWRGRMGQTRWMRREGPGGTPVGGFVGRLVIAALVGAGQRELPVFDIALAGTTGLRPMRGDPDDTTAVAEGRCTAPRRDEGWYVGRIDRRALFLYARELGDERGVIQMLRRIDRGLLAGNFEGRLGISAADDRSIDYSKIEKGAWWFDGLFAWKCRHPHPDPAPEPTEDGAGAAAEADVSVETR